MAGDNRSPPGLEDLLGPEIASVRALDQEAHQSLGPHYRWYHQVRSAKRGELHLFGEANLEEQMLATRSALGSITGTLNAGLVQAFNAVVEGVSKAGGVPTGWPEKVEMPDRNNPPLTGAAHDTVIIAYHPLKFAGLAKPVRDKGKGLPFYTDGLVKKLWFKVVGYYCDETHWDAERLGWVVGGLADDTPLQEVQTRLAPLKTDIDLLTQTLQPFRFGSARLGATSSETKSSAEELYKFSDSELVQELYFQSLIVHGLVDFTFRYYVTLLGSLRNLRALHALSLMFQPLIVRAEELRMQFQTSFLMERDKSRLRNGFQEFYKEQEGRSGQEGEKLTHRLIDAVALARSPQLNERQAHPWTEVLKREVLAEAESPRGCALLVEVLNVLVSGARSLVETRAKMAKMVRDFATDQEKLGLSQLSRKKHAAEEQKRVILRKAARFKAEKQPDAAQAYETQAATLDAENQEQFEQLQQSINRRRDALIARAEQMDAQAKEEVQVSPGRAAAAVYGLANAADPEHKLRGRLVPFLLQHLQEAWDPGYEIFYRSLFTVVGDLSAMEKMVLRKAIAARIKLDDTELVVTEGELKEHQQNVVNQKTELLMEAPGVLEQKLIQGQVQMRVDDLLKLSLNTPSLLLLLQLPLAAPNKAPAKLAPPVIRKVLILNQLMNPLAENDLVLPNVEADAPVTKRINFTRLAKMQG